MSKPVESVEKPPCSSGPNVGTTLGPKVRSSSEMILENGMLKLVGGIPDPTPADLFLGSLKKTSDLTVLAHR